MINKNRLILIAVIIILGGIFMYGRNENKSAISKLVSTKTTPTPYPFREMTIPYLRERSYETKLGNKTISYETNTYTAYLTSYDSDGLKINGLLTEPKGNMPQGGWPAVVFVHGYIPPTQYRTTERYYDYVDYLARNGLAVFKIDLRGHGDSEGEATGAYYSGDYVIDTLNAYAALQSSGFINPEKVGLWGHSMAGNVVMRSLAVKPEIPAAVIWAGAVYTYTDQRKYGISDASYRPPQMITQRQNRRQQLYDTHGEPGADTIFWRDMAPTNFLNDLKGAIQIHHAEDDTVVNIGYSRDLIKLLDKTKVEHELFEYSTGGHNISGSSFNEAMQRTTDFYLSHLK